MRGRMLDLGVEVPPAVEEELDQLVARPPRGVVERRVRERERLDECSGAGLGVWGYNPVQHDRSDFTQKEG